MHATLPLDHPYYTGHHYNKVINDPQPYRSNPSSRRTSMVSPTAILTRNRSQKSIRDRRRSSGTLSTHSQKPRKMIGDYYVGKTLGKGASGRVKLGVHRFTGEQVAIKIISKAHLAANPAIEKAVRREIAIMKLICHPNVMGLVDVIDDASSPDLHLILEYVEGGELFEYLVSKGKLSEAEARHHFQQIILGLDYCHHHLICHRDLKPENLLLDLNQSIKIADFGMASLQPAGSMLETSCGSPHYASPEIVAGMPYNGSASDIWSCGIILYALLTGHLPFDDENIRQLLKKVKAGKYTIPDEVSPKAKDLITRILVVDPSKRLTMEQIMAHPWFREVEPTNLAMLPIAPTAEQIGRPVNDSSEIDERLLETIKFLWGETSDEVIIDALINSEPNMQKVVYVLLQQHAERYWQMEHDDDDYGYGEYDSYESFDSIHSQRRYRTVSHRTERDRRCMSMVDNGKHTVRPTSPWLCPDDEKQVSRRFSAASMRSPRQEFLHHPPPLPPLPSGAASRKHSADKTAQAMKKSETFYARFIKSVLPSSLHQNKDAHKINGVTQDESDPKPSASSFAGTLRRKNPFAKAAAAAANSHEASYDAGALIPELPPKSTLRSNKNKVDPQQQKERPLSCQPPPKVANPKRLSIRVPHALRNTLNTLNGSRRSERKQLDMSVFTDPSLPPPPALSDGSTLSSSSSSSSGSSSAKTPTMLSPTAPITPRRGSQVSIRSDRRASTSVNRPVTPSLLSNSSTITTSAASEVPSLSPYTSSPSSSVPKTSWLSNLFHFKQPKVCSLIVTNTNTTEILRALHRAMNDFSIEARFYEKCDKQGVSRFKAEIKTAKRQVKCRMEFLVHTNYTCVQFTQQQGDGVLLASTVRQLQDTMLNNMSTVSTSSAQSPKPFAS
ncbi:uncharacterized protein BYT42DRAFT_617113 [Radiomyces spectabilis]|uniref:uncharacterized protein n=1 Tax=Radiomyces spectabilis TaxID=64574 RepID=UPI002220D4BE|nr:uncharacterized protein BYT42DRAFT_617113 [Radiomyces spectabilis]KAI8370570.1 hypothetical protein BYT42DRAFT_617113 [Radiomyces spectabilis]